MADTPFISQEVIESAPDNGSAEISQSVLEGGADNAPPSISQAVLEAGADDATILISQVVIEWSRGPLVPPPASTGTFRFDAGTRSNWWLVPQLTDSGVELRDKVVKPVRVTGKMGSPSFIIYGYGPGQPIDVAAIEAGIGGRHNPKPLPEYDQVTQTPRKPINVPNCMLHTIRLSGIWEGGMKDRIDEIVYEVAVQGIRR